MRKLKQDLTGKKFGMLTVTKMLPNYKGNHKVYCECKCECGNEVIRRADILQRTKIPTCGCVSTRPKENKNARLDYVGRKIGHLSVIAMLNEYEGKKGSFCRCVCDCGNECVVPSYGLLKRKHPPSCGCMKKYYQQKQAERNRKDYTGMRFGRLVVEYMKYNTGSTTYAHCLCDCGNHVDIRATELTRKDGKATRSCGCLQAERTSNANYIDQTGRMFNNGVKALRPARQTPRGVWEWYCECPVCGKEFIALPAKVQSNCILSCGCSRASSGEILVANILNNMNIAYETEYTFSGCKDKLPLPFDFYIQEYNTAIEYQGRQHYVAIDYFGGESGFNKRVSHDAIKRTYCQENQITLIEISYLLSYDDIYKLLQTSFIRRDCNG